MGVQFPLKKEGPEAARERLQKRHSALIAVRSEQMADWEDIADYILPRQIRIDPRNVNRKVGGASKIYNSRAGRGVRICASGMNAGITSKARRWFSLTTPSSDLANDPEVKAWLHFVEELIREALAKSNFYKALAQLYYHLVAFGTSAMLIEEDHEEALRCYVFPLGEYSLTLSARLQVNGVYRDLCMSVAQLVEHFGYDACSREVRKAFDDHEFERLIEIVHVVEPNRELQLGKLDVTGKKWLSLWYEKATEPSEGFLRARGYRDFPVMAPRWMTLGLDVYGVGPGHEALPDTKGLQQLAKRKLQITDKLTEPPMVVPPNLGVNSMLPGQLIAVSEADGVKQVRAAYSPDPAAIPAIREDVQDHEGRIDSAFFADLFLLLANDNRSNVTATEVTERHEEKMLQLGPVLEALEDELLDPAIDRVFSILLEKGVIPPPPESLFGSELRVEYISILAQAQKMLGITSLERFAGYASSLAQNINPQVLDLIDADALLREYSGMLGMKPDLLVAQQLVKKLRAMKAQQKQQLDTMNQMLQGSQAAKNLSGATLQDDNALARMLGAMPGVAAGAAGAGPGAMQAGGAA